MLLPLLMVAAQGFDPCPDQVPLTQLQSVFPYGHAHGLGIDQEERFAYMGEGASISILDLQAPVLGEFNPLASPQVVARIPCDASIMKLLPIGDDLYVAGGSQGLLHVDIGPENTADCDCQGLGRLPGCYKVTILDDDDLRPTTKGNLRDNEKWCFDVTSANVVVDGGTLNLLAAVFASYYDPADPGTTPSELRLYDRTRNVFLRSIPLPPGTAYSVAYHRSQTGEPSFFIGMGTGGIVRVTLDGVVTPGPVFDRENPPTILPAPESPWLSTPPYNGNGVVRSIAVTQTHLYAAVDEWGVVQVPIGDDVLWPPTQPLRSRPLFGVFNRRGEGETPLCQAAVSYAHTVSAVKIGGLDILAVGASRYPVYQDEAQPYFMYGRWSVDLNAGGDGFIKDGWPGIYMFQANPGAIAQIGVLPSKPSQQYRGPAGGRLVMRPAGEEDALVRLYMEATDRSLNRTRAAFIVRDFDPTSTSQDDCSGSRPGAFRPVLALESRGVGTTMAKPSLVDPHLLYQTYENTISEPLGFMNISSPECPRDLAPTREAFKNYGYTAMNAHWLDDEPGVEWFITGTPSSWTLNRKDTNEICATSMWQLNPIRDCDDLRGREYFSAHQDEDDVFLVRSGSRYGVMVHSRDALVAEAESGLVPYCWNLGCTNYSGNGFCVEPNIEGVASCLLLTTPRYVIDTHPEMAGWDPQYSASNPGGFQNWQSVWYGATLIAQDVAVFERPGTDSRFLAIAAGNHANDVDRFPADGVPDDPDFRHGKLVIAEMPAVPNFGVTCNGLAIEDPIAVTFSDHEGAYFAIEIQEFCGVPFAFIGDLAGTVSIYDLSNPYLPRLVDEWVAPLNPLDNYHDNVIDLKILSEMERTYVYVSLARRGLVRLGLNVSECGSGTPSLQLPPPGEWLNSSRVTVMDTPGTAHFLTVRDGLCRVNGEIQRLRGMILGDKHAGFRMYGSFEWNIDAFNFSCD